MQEYNMKNPFSPLARTYLSEVLGVKNYLCPESIYSLRSLKGGLPCRVLAVVFKELSLSQKALLKKIMASIEVFEFSLLEIKDQSVLKQLICFENRLADFILFFGGKNWLDSEQKALAALSGQPVSFLRLYSLEELDGNAPEIINRKKQIWEQLKKWKEVLKV